MSCDNFRCRLGEAQDVFLGPDACSPPHRRQSAIDRLPRQANFLRDLRPYAVECKAGWVATRSETQPRQQSLVRRAYIANFLPGTQVAHLARHYTRELQHLGGVAPHVPEQVALVDHHYPRWGLNHGVAVIGVGEQGRFGKRITGPRYMHHDR
jgi:hypothetical protein